MNVKHENERPTAPAPQAPGETRAAAPSAFGFEKLGGRLQRFLLKRLRNRETAKDLTQEVYLRLLRFGDPELVRSPDAYLYQVALNVLSEFRLSEQRVPVTFDSETAEAAAEALVADSPSAEEALDYKLHEHRLDAVLQELPTMQRAVFLLAIRHDLAHADIADKLQISMHTVRKYLYRAILHCRQRLPGA